MKSLFFWITFFFCVGIQLSAQNFNKKESQNGRIVKFGLKAGANSSVYSISDLSINSISINQTENFFRLGYEFSLFSRIPFYKKNFLQPCITYQYNHCEVEFENADISTNSILLNSTISTIDIPILYGYNFIDEDPYKCAILVGPKLKYAFNRKCDFEITDTSIETITEMLNPYNISALFGISFTISNLYFDFMIEKGFTNISKSIQPNVKNNSNNDKVISALQSMTFKRKCESITFSMGFIF